MWARVPAAPFATDTLDAPFVAPDAVQPAVVWTPGAVVELCG